jgi:hypothetical protein
VQSRHEPKSVRKKTISAETVADNAKDAWSELPFFEEDDSGFSDFFSDERNRKMPVTPQQLATIPLYSGATDVELYFAALERAADLYTWDDGETCTAAKSRLAGAGEIFLESLRKQHVECVVYLDRAAAGAGANAVAAQTGIKKRLRVRFGEIVTEIAAADAVTSLHQKTGETVSDFNDRCVVAIDRMNHTYTDIQKQQPAYQGHFTAMLYTFLASGLKEEIRSRTLGAATPPRTAEALLTAAKSVESEMARSRKTKTMMEIERADDPAAVETMEFPTTIQGLRNLMAVMMSGQGQAGENKEAAAVTNKPASTTSAANANATCYNCRGKGHLSLVCPSPKGTAKRSRERGGGYGNNQTYRPQMRGGRGANFYHQPPAGRYMNRGGYAPRYPPRGAGRGYSRSGGRPVWLAEYDQNEHWQEEQNEEYDYEQEQSENY